MEIPNLNGRVDWTRPKYSQVDDWKVWFWDLFISYTVVSIKNKLQNKYPVNNGSFFMDYNVILIYIEHINNNQHTQGLKEVRIRKY